MTHDELLAEIKLLGETSSIQSGLANALRSVVCLAVKPIDASGSTAQQVAWFYEGYNLALDNVLDAIEKELR